MISKIPVIPDELENIKIEVKTDTDTDYFLDILAEKQYLISNSYDAGDFGILYIYKIKTRNPVDFVNNKEINGSDIIRIVELYSSDQIETSNPSYRTFKITDKNVIKELTTFMNSGGQTLSFDVLTILKTLSIKEFFPIKVYRGMTFKDSNFIKRYKVGDKFLLSSLNRVQSWSTIHCIPESFSSRDKYGIIVSTVLNPEDIAIDTRLLDQKQLTSLFWREQREVMSLPYNDDGNEKKFMVTIESLLRKSRSDPRNMRITDINNLKYYNNFPSKDLSILDYKIGAPISRLEAYENFFNSNINVNQVPKSQKELIQDDVFIDPITLDETPLTELIQLKECGTILSKDTIKELFDRNTNEWQGKENIGFRSPITNTIYGNLVLYNYNDDFLSQQPGSLMIQTKETMGIKDTTTGKPVISWYEIYYTNHSGISYTFRANGADVIMYYPMNESGKKIVMLLCECFKKGNLFAFDPDGRGVRHGRVHKKTSLQSNEFGYPDDTYEMRVTGELMDMGCTPYTTEFNYSPFKIRDDLTYIKDETDPYPEEKRWTVVFLTKKPKAKPLDIFGDIFDDIPDVFLTKEKKAKKVMVGEESDIKTIKSYLSKKSKEIYSAESEKDLIKIIDLTFAYLSKNKAKDFMPYLDELLEDRIIEEITSHSKGTVIVIKHLEKLINDLFEK